MGCGSCRGTSAQINNDPIQNKMNIVIIEQSQEESSQNQSRQNQQQLRSNNDNCNPSSIQNASYVGVLGGASQTDLDPSQMIETKDTGTVRPAPGTSNVNLNQTQDNTNNNINPEEIDQSSSKQYTIPQVISVTPTKKNVLEDDKIDKLNNQTSDTIKKSEDIDQNLLQSNNEQSQQQQSTEAQTSENIYSKTNTNNTNNSSLANKRKPIDEIDIDKQRENNIQQKYKEYVYSPLKQKNQQENGLQIIVRQYSSEKNPDVEEAKNSNWFQFHKVSSTESSKELFNNDEQSENKFDSNHQINDNNYKNEEDQIQEDDEQQEEDEEDNNDNTNNNNNNDLFQQFNQNNDNLLIIFEEQEQGFEQSGDFNQQEEE